MVFFIAVCLDQTLVHRIVLQDTIMYGHPSNEWYMLRAAVVASFFMVKTVKPAPIYKKIAGGSKTLLSSG